MTCNTVSIHAPRRTHRVTASPRFRADRGALWLGLGLCFITLLALRGSDAR